MHKVTFARSSKTVVWDQEFESLLEFAESHGVMIHYCCCAGIDMVCATRLLRGDVEYLDVPYVDPGQGYALPCVCKPSSDIVVDA